MFFPSQAFYYFKSLQEAQVSEAAREQSLKFAL